VPPGEVAAVNARLVGAGLAVSELTRTERSLEQAFFDLTTTIEEPRHA
jgi:hypothetical protein